MPAVRIKTLGSLSIAVDGQPVDWLASQRMRVACLVYIAIERDVSRDRLLGVFWPEVDSDRARRSLNQIIYTLRRSLGEAAILTDGDRVRVGPGVDVDVAMFTAAVQSGDLTQAAEQYGGRFLADTVWAGSAEFEHWVDAKRAALEREHRHSRRAAIDQLKSAGDPAGALRVARQWAELDPDDDEAQHRYLELLIDRGRRIEAIRHFEEYCARLRCADLEPLEDTVALIASLRGRTSDAAPVPGFRAPPDPQLTAAAEALEHSEPSPAGFVTQIRRRGVLGALGMYVVLAWGAIEASATIFPLLNLPEWGPRFITVLALIGLPFTAFFAWQYDITRAGIHRTMAAAASGATRRRVMPRWATLTVLGGVLLFGAWSAYERFRPRPVHGSVAVFPFCVTGEEFENEADDIALWLARRIDEIPELQSADPNALISAAEAAKLQCRDARAASEIAERQGANRFILGSLTRAEDRISADATLYDLNGEMKWSVPASAPTAAWLQIVDSLARGILEKQGASKGDRMLAVATTTKSSNALQAYLEGERHLRALAWNRATEAYEKAVRFDTTFALAWLRLAESLQTGSGPVARRQFAVQQAKRYSTQLPEREQRLLHAFDAYQRGAAAESIERLRGYLGLYPGDPQAWFWLGESEYYWGRYFGHDFSDAISAYRRAAELGNPDALFMLAWAYIDAGDYARSDSVTRQVVKVGAGGDWVIGLEAAHAFRSGDRARIDKMLARIEMLQEWQRSNGPSWATWAHEYALAEQIAERAVARPQSAGAHKDALLKLMRIRLARGKRVAAESLLDQVAAIDPAAVQQYRIDTALKQRNASALREMRRVLEGQADSLSKLKAGEAPYVLPVRLYWLGRISVALSDTAAAHRYARRLEPVPGTKANPTGNGNLGAAIRMHVALANADTAVALKHLDRAVYVLPAWDGIPGEYDLGPERWLKAEILMRRGQFADASRWINVWFGADNMDALKRQGELFERLGDHARARRMYERLRDLLAECDPEFRPLRQFAEQRLKVLNRT